MTSRPTDRRPDRGRFPLKPPPVATAVSSLQRRRRSPPKESSDPADYSKLRGAGTLRSWCCPRSFQKRFGRVSGRCVRKRSCGGMARPPGRVIRRVARRRLCQPTGRTPRSSLGFRRSSIASRNRARPNTLEAGSISTTTNPASTSTSCPGSRCSLRPTSSTPGPAGRASPGRSIPSM